MAHLSRSTMLAELSPPAAGSAASLQAGAQASVGFEQAVAALVQHASSRPYQSVNQSLLVRLRMFMPSSLAYALKELGAAATTGVLHMLADAAFLFSSVQPIALAFLEEEFSIVSFVKSVPESELDDVAWSVVLLNSIQCLPPQQGVISLFTHHVPSIRWMAVLCMARYLRLSAPEVQAFTQRALSGAHVRFQCESGLQQRERNLQALYASIWHMEEQDGLCDNSQQELRALCEAAPAPSGFVNLCGALVRCKTGSIKKTPSRAPQAQFVSTPAMLSALHSSAVALSSGRCLLLSGPSGCGKSCLVHNLAAATHNEDMLELYMDANTDSRALLGSYMCSQTPGEFFWQPGPLSQAVKSGRWLVLDNLHLAPADVFASLETIISSGVLHLPQRGEVIAAHKDFRLITTVQTGTSEHPEDVRHVLPRAVLADWWHVRLPAAQRHEQVQVLAGRFPSITALLYPVIALSHLVHIAMRPPSASTLAGHSLESQDNLELNDIDGVWSPWAAAVQQAMVCEQLHPGELLLSVSKAPGMHDLVKICARLAELGGTAAALQHVYGVDPSSSTRTQVVLLPVDARQAMLVEAADVFCGCSVGKEAKVKQLKAMARILGLPQECGAEVLSQPAAVGVQAGTFSVGRARLPCMLGKFGPSSHEMLMGSSVKPSKFAFTTHSTQTMQSIAVAVQMSEPLLLVGESGTGKTTIIQHIAQQVGKEVVAINFSSQSESSDLLGGMKPVQVGATLMSLYRTFTELLQCTWPDGKNADFLTRVHKFVRDENWPKLTKAFDVALKKVLHARAAAGEEERPAKKAKLSVNALSRWDDFASKVDAAKRTVDVSTQGFAFEFVEGALVKALRTGQWLLLDEINMAPPQVLESIMCLLDSTEGGISLLDRPGSEQLQRHPDFRMFGAMNPATDTGKRHLPAQIKAHFTEVYISEPQDKEDLVPIITAYLPGTSLPPSTIDGIVAFFKQARVLASGLSDGSSAPAYNLRTLARSIQYVSYAATLHGTQRALFDGFAMCFAGMLEADSAALVLDLLKLHILHNKAEPSLPSVTRSLPKALAQRTQRFVNIEGYWIPCGTECLPDEGGPSVEGFILTQTVRAHVRAVARALTMQQQCPILLQGPTSSGKTTLVEYIAKTTGHKTVRINNHQHTDLQEYLGAYSADDKGNLVFHEGALVCAARNGDWVILDELNLAPTDVLEALNRLLDDNHELFVPELQETIKPHPHFMLFGTQNPAGAYAGRKMLSRALRSRFLQIMIPDLPSSELITVLEQRCAIPASHAGKLVTVMNELRILRSRGNVFAGCHGLITPRDLFRWASRQGSSYEELSMHGYSLLAERLRTKDERNQVLQVIATIIKAKFEPALAYATEGVALQAQLQEAVERAEPSDIVHQLKHVVWTKTLQRMHFLAKQALEHKEAVLLVGETGVGKTTLCQTLAFVRGQQLLTINCNMHTEASDFLGGYRPARNRIRAFSEYVANYNELARSQEIAAQSELPPPPDDLDTHQIAASLQVLERAVAAAAGSLSQAASMDSVRCTLDAARKSAAAACVPFVWEDGPLVTAMKQGCLLLIDEINLAEDAVLERLNSVLEPGRMLLLAEKGGPTAEQIVAAEGFRVVATMNPGGDHGKRELSPALSNRFTQVWVSDIDDCEDILKLVSVHLPATSGVEEIIHKILQFWEWHSKLQVMGKSKLSNRDLLAWCQFIREMHRSLGLLQAYLHGIFLVLIDGSGLGSSADPHALKHACVQYLHQSTPDTHSDDLALAACVENWALPTAGPHEELCGDEMACGVSHWGIQPFVVPIGDLFDAQLSTGYHLDAPTTARNCFRLLRAMQMPKPILLEGSPGVGKTSLITAIAAAMGHELIRVNLSEQTEMADLLGADLPAPDGTSGAFEWAPGPLLRAVRSGAWVILDELNLASQAVLEGLNSVLDHRREIFIPELDETVRCAANFRVFAAQNPVHEGGGRKGLPKSFLNRFSRICLELLQPADLLVILQQMHPHLPASCLECMVKTVGLLHESVNLNHAFGHTGGPWEFNLRDISRWCDLISAAGVRSESAAVALSGHYAAMLFSHKMQSKADKQQAEALIEQCWNGHPLQEEFCRHLRCPQKVSVALSSESIGIGWCELSRTEQIRSLPPGASSQLNQAIASSGLELASSSVPALEWIATACKMAWMAILVSPDVRRATHIVRTLASVCSQPLVEIPMSSTSDISDLLGGFEQMDFGRKLRSATSHVQHVAMVMLKDILSSPEFSADSHNYTLKLLQQIQCVRFDDDESTAIQNATAVIKQLQQAVTDLHAVNAQSAWSASVAGALGDVLAATEAAVAEVADMLRDGKVVSTGGRFVWVDGLLLSAIENGHWALMLHANTCSAAVLDRLNSLLEPSGSLYINECGSCAGGPRIVRPHPNFRLLIVMDPSDGGLSRAMRNRGVEIYFDAHKFDENPSKELALEELNRVRIPGNVLPEWLHAQLSSNKTLFRESLWQRQHNTQLLAVLLYLVESGSAPLPALITAQKLVPPAEDGMPQSTVDQLAESFSAFSLETQGSDSASGAQCSLSLTSSCSSLVAFPSLASSACSVSWQVAAALLRLPNVLMAQLVCSCIFMSRHNNTAIDCLPPPLITLPDPSHKQRGSISRGLKDACAAVQLLLTSTSSESAFWVREQLQQDWDELQCFLKGKERLMRDGNVASIVCWYQSTMDVMRPETVTQVHMLSQELRPSFSAALTSCEQLSKSLEQVLTKAAEGSSEPRTIADLSAALSHGKLRAPLLLHPVVPVVVPVLRSLLVLQRATLSGVLCDSDSAPAVLHGLRQLQLAQHHIWQISLASAWEDLQTSVAQRLTFLMLNIAELWEVFSGLQGTVPCLRLSSTVASLSQFTTELSIAKKALQLHSHAPEASLLRTQAGHLQLPSSAQHCEQWLQLQKLSTCFDSLHLATSEHTLAALHTASLDCELLWPDSEDDSSCSPHREQALRAAAALLACSQSSKNMLSEGAALLLAESIRGVESEQTADSEPFSSLVVSHTTSAIHHIMQSVRDSQVTPRDAADVGALVMQPLAPEHFRTSSGVQFQAAMSQLEILIHGPLFRGALAMVGIAPQKSDKDAQMILEPLLGACKQSSVVAPLFSAALRVVSWSVTEAQDVRMKAAHAANWYSSKSSLCLFRSPLKFSSAALSELLPWRLRDAMSHPAGLPGHSAASFAICEPLPLCLSQMLNPSGITLQALPSCKDALSHTLHSLLCSLAVNQVHKAHPVLLHLATVASTASQTLHIFSSIVGDSLAALAQCLAHVVSAICCTELAALPHVVDACSSALAPACAAMQACSIPGLPEGCAVIAALIECVQDVAEETVTVDGSNQVLDLTPTLLAKCGHVAVVFSIWRASSLMPPPGLDPAMMAFEEQHHVRYTSDAFVAPWLRVARATQRMPLLPDQTPEIVALEHQMEEAEEKCSQLQDACIPRPDPPQYIPLVSEVQHCVQTMLPAARDTASSVLGLISRQGDFEASHASQILTECENQVAALVSWGDRIEAEFSLYADQFSPFLLAVRDVHYGISVLNTALQQHVQQDRFSVLCDPSFLRSCFQYPIMRSHCNTSLQPLKDAAACCSSPEVTAVLKTAVIERLSESSVSDKLLHALPRILAVQLQLKGQMMQLRMCGLLRSQQSQETLHSSLGHIVTLWNVGKELQDELHQREESMYKSSSRMDQIIIRTEDEELDTEVAKAVSEATSLFADLMAAPDDGEDMPETNADAKEHEDASSIVIKQLSIMLQDTDMQQSIVEAHQRALAHVLSQCNRLDSFPTMPNDPEDTLHVADCLSTVGTQLLEACGGYASGDLRSSTIGTCIRQILSSFSQLTATKQDSASVDVYKPCVAEMILAVSPVQSLFHNVEALLDRFPEQPMLEKLQTICRRVLGMPVHGSLKDAMIGMELLMANVNEWQKHSASEREKTSLAQHQPPLAALAARWRNLELSSWSLTMTKALEKVKSCAYVHWFHLMSVCFPSNGTTPQIVACLPVVEQFFQSSSLGQFEARLDLLKLCCKHCSVLVACGHNFTELATCLQNVHSYYAQHLPAVKQALETALESIRKEMKDFVTLQKWDHHGAYDLKLLIDKTQRKLASCSKRTASAAAELITPALARTANSIGSELVRGLVAHTPDESKGSDSVEGKGTSISTIATAKLSSLPRPVQSAVGVLSLWSRMAKVPAVVEAWLASKCMALKEEHQTLYQAQPLMGALGPVLSDASSWRNRDQNKIFTRLLTVLSDPGTTREAGSATHTLSLPASLDGVSQVATSLFDEAGSLADSMKGLWAHDGQKGSRSMRKKALTDLVKLLASHGFSTSKAAVPIKERSQQAWFTSKQQPQLPDRILAAMPLPLGPQVGNPGYLQELWSPAFESFQQVMGGVHGLRQASQNSLNTDISQREASHMCGIAEHAWYLLRQQHHALHDGCEQLCVLEHSVELLECAAAHAQDCFRPDHAQAQLQSELEVLQNGIQDCRHFMQQLQALCPPSNMLRSRALVQRFNGAKQALAASLENICHAEKQLSTAVAAASPLERTHAICSLPSQPVVFTPSLVQAMKSAASVLEECHRVVFETGGTAIPDLMLPVISGNLTVRHVFPSWKELEGLVGQVVADIADIAGTVSPETDAPMPSAPEPISSAAEADVQQFAHSIEACLQYTLLWAQEAPKPHTELDGLGAAQAVAVLKACVQAPSIDKLADALASCAQFAGKLSGSDAQVVALVSQLRGVLPMVRTVLVAMRAALVHAVLLQTAFSQLTLVMIAVFVSYVKEGFGEGVTEEQEGADGAGTGTFKQEHGTGLGDGETAGAEDVSNQIENEDQIMGAQQEMEPEECEEDKDGSKENQAEDADGVEMEQEFDGELHDGELEPEGEDEEDAAETEKELEKEMGDAGDDAEVLDEKMWFGEDEGEEPEDNEQRKDAGTTDTKSNSKGDEDTRKLVAGDREEQEDEKEDPDQDENAQDNANDKTEAEDQPGLMEENEVAEQMEAQDFLQPQAEQPELEVPEDLNLDNEAMDQEDGDGEAADTEADASEQNIPEEEDPSTAPDLDRAEPPSDAEMQQDDTIAEDTENQDDACDAAREDATKTAEEQLAEEQQEEAEKEEAEGAVATPQAEKDADDPVEDQSIAGPQGGHSNTAPEADQDGAGAPESAAAEEDKKDAHAQKRAQAKPQSDLQPPQPDAAEKDSEENDLDRSQAQDAGAGAGGADAAPQPSVADTGAEAPAFRADAHRQQSNPLHDLGSAQEQWRKDFDIVSDAIDDKAEIEEQQVDENSAAAQAVKFAAKEDSSTREQVLAAATQEQAEEQAGAGADPEGEGKEQGMELDEHIADQENNDSAPAVGSSDAAVQGNAPLEHVDQDDQMKDVEEAQDGLRADQLDDAADHLHGHDANFAAVETVRAVDVEMASEEAMGALDDTDAKIQRDVATVSDSARGYELWQRCTAATTALTGELIEQLRLVLQPTLASRLSGGYKTGKRLNMKKLIRYIASSFRQDKIWMRRTSPNQRQYQVLLAIDETKSMQENRCDKYAMEALTLMTTALSRLEVGRMGVAAYGGPSGTRVLHDLAQPWSDASAASVLGSLRFDADNTLQDTPLLDLLQTAGGLFEVERHQASSLAGAALPSQLLLIVADGHFHERTALQRAVRQAGCDSTGEGPLIVFIILDAAKESVLDLQQVVFENGVPSFIKYLDGFPFPYYMILRDIQRLPHLLADLLRQWLQVCSG